MYVPIHYMEKEKIEELGENLSPNESINDETDFSIFVGEKCIKVHKQILLDSSSYFVRLFNSGMIESTAVKTIITHFDYEIVEAGIQILYNPSKIPTAFTFEQMLELLRFSDKYDIQKIKIWSKTRTLNTALSTRTGDAINCPNSDDIACVMKYDSAQKNANYMCSKNNCSVNGVVIRELVCVNVSTTQKNCCCYTDACSYWFLTDVLPVLMSPSNYLTALHSTYLNVTTSTTALTTTKPPPKNTLRCLQGPMDITYLSSLEILNSPSAATPCIDTSAVTCGIGYLPAIKTISFFCSNSYCTRNGKDVNETVCNDYTLQKSCCCYGNGCNSAFMANELKTYVATLNSTTTISKPTKKPLRCLQGVLEITRSINAEILSSPNNMPLCLESDAVTCRAEIHLSRYTSYSCSNLNCSFNGTTYREAMCVNTSTSTSCCCYGDGCNAAPMEKEKPNAAVITSINLNFSMPTSNLSCLQAYNEDVTNLTATKCSNAAATACLIIYSPKSNFTWYTCSWTNCSDYGQNLREPICVNVNSTQTHCCCYGNSCNTPAMLKSSLMPPPYSLTNNATKNVTLFAPSNTSTNNITKNITSTLTTRDAAGGCENGYKILSSSADTSIAGKGKFAGYLGYRSSCQELCDKSFGLVKCVAYMFELHNRGKCTLFHQPVDADVIEILNSGASVSVKC